MNYEQQQYAEYFLPLPSSKQCVLESRDVDFSYLGKKL